MFENIKCLISRKTDKFNLILDPLCDESVSNCDRYNDRKLVEDEEENSEEYTTVNELEGESSRHKYCLNKLQITSKRLDFVDSGTSFVWKRGFSQKYNKEINVKIITSNPDILDDINNEISLWRDLSSERHENLLNILECFENQHFRYVVTHKLDGEISLQKFLVENNRAFSEFQARKVFLGIISAVEFCHGKQVAHRDIKPQHFLVSRNLQVKLSGMNYDTGRRELSRHWHERAIRSVTRRCRAFSIFQNVKYNNKNYTEVLFTNVHIFSPNDIFFAK